MSTQEGPTTAAAAPAPPSPSASSAQTMAVSPQQLQQLKHRLFTQYEEDMERVAARTAALTTLTDGTTSTGTLPSASSLSLELLCRRAGLSDKAVALTAREQIVLMTNAMPPVEVMVEERLRRAQEESVQLLVRKTCAALPRSNSGETPTELMSDAQAREALANAPVPVTSEDRLRLLEEMHAENMRLLPKPVEPATLM